MYSTEKNEDRVGEQKFSTEDSSVDMKIFSEDPRWNFSGEDSSLDEKKATEDVVLVKFFVVHAS